jgi:hypothetical protein
MSHATAGLLITLLAIPLAMLVDHFIGLKVHP